MASLYPILIVGIGGCWSLPLPSSVTLLWSLQDDGHNQTSFLCLMPEVYDMATTMWSQGGNHSQSRNVFISRLNAATVRITSKRQYLLQYGDLRPHLLAPLSPSDRRESSPAIFWSSPPYSLLMSWEFSSPSRLDPAFVPSLDHLGSFMDKDVNPLLKPSSHLQDLGASTSHIVSPETLQLSALSSLFELPDPVMCSVAQAEHDEERENHEVLSGGNYQPVCNEEKPAAELGHHMMQDALLLMAMKTITLKLIIFDLLMTGAAMMETYQEFLHTTF
ncbi:uncharacterized protein [Engystomops pustulosus]|uniref:uncharacterized protein n=1 Tax=Engystomops pustulosus TaxID=76066 RepID=UPI003AFB23A4